MPVLLTGEESRDPKIIEREPLEELMRPMGDAVLGRCIIDAPTALS
jgi:hypothetical protein